MVPCAQGRVIVETARPAPPYFATCTRYRRAVVVTSAPNEMVASVSGTTSSSGTQLDQQSTCSVKNVPIPLYSTAARPEDLGVTPWYLEDYPTIDSSPGPTGDRSSYPSYLYAVEAEPLAKPDTTVSTRNSSTENEPPRPTYVGTVPRKAYMDLRDAIALLDETCPNQEVSPSLTPRTPRTPLTPHPRNKRARSKSSDNSSNYSNDRLSDRSFENARSQDKEKKRPFLKKIGISKTEDKPFLAKFAPKIIGKPYLEKIGPSKAVERPFLNKIGSSKTLDKFIFDAPRYKQKNASKSETTTTTTTSTTAAKSEQVETVSEPKKPEEYKALTTIRSFGVERRRSGKGHLLKMYSFETEDLESTVQVEDTRDPLRGGSLDDVLDSGPSSLPLETIADEATKPETNQRPANGAELLKCRVTTSEEIIYTNASFGSDKEPNSWGNSPKKKWCLIKGTTVPRTPTRCKVLRGSPECSVPNSPTKRSICTDTSQPDIPEKSVCSPTKTRRQAYEDDKSSKQAQFERRGISSDNLLTKDRSSVAAAAAKETSSVDSLAHRGAHEYTKETFKQLQDKFKYHEIPMETYADFKRRTRGSVQSVIARQQDRPWTSARDDVPDDTTTKDTESSAESIAEKKSETVLPRGGTVRSVLKKQQGVDHPSDQEWDSNSSVRRPKRRIFHEPSQETMDLLTELRKVKSQLKTPSWEKDLELETKPARQPKRILLTDKEFCLSVERENSIRRPSRILNSLERTEEGASNGNQEDDNKEPEERKAPGPALFEKKCLSLDYVDEDKPQKPEARAISLASTRNLDKSGEMVDYADFALICDSKSYSSDVFNTPTEETNEEKSDNDLEKEISQKMDRNHCTEVDITVPIDQKPSSPKGSVHVQGRTSDLYEIISPRSTPFRVKKRLGKISVEDTVKPEGFTLGSKVDCQSAVAQKRTKCFPL
ncbi:uncharacterized protein LOC122397021 [Colletes gigas]|uniref:uncharacterized protein LOC122397021 n=1 Tax=Colletes gigas TaxID=935657 RepID=UPI001C9AE419|nr:uncharacterized protein LOC122397021 [Colletes gigas]